MKKKRIYWYNAHFLFAMGGAKFIFDVVNHFDQKRFEIILIVNNLDEKVVKNLNTKNVKIVNLHRLNTSSLLYWLFLPLNILIDYIKIKPLINDADGFITTFFPPSLTTVLLAKKLHKPVFNYCFEPFPFLQNPQFISQQPFPKNFLMKILSCCYKKWDNYAITCSTKVFTLNQITKKMISQVYHRPDAIVTLMGVDSSHFHHYISEEIKAKYAKNLVVVHSTDYSATKRTDLAIIIISHLVKKYPNLKLLITSTQPNHPEKYKLIDLAKKLDCAENVEFLGLVSYADLVSYYSLAIVYLSCSYDEMMGTTSSNLPVKEALACETPAIRADITTEDVENNISGFLVNPLETHIAAKKIDYLIQHPDIAQQMGKMGRKKIKKLYNWDNVSQVMQQEIEKELL